MRLANGQRVVFFAQWSTWRGMKGRVVVGPGPGLYVLIDGDRHPVAVSASEIVEDSDAVTFTGAE